MPKALIDPALCDPERCADGRCLARRACPTKAIYQTEPYDVPATDSGRCHGCSKCLVDCPLRAVHLV